MRFKDIFKSDNCKDIYEGINKYSTFLLKEYNDQIESLGFVSKPKDIFDFVWGTIELSKIEIGLIDSPLIQRLRNIKQLGFAHCVYCNADYSRFAHTIGVTEVAGRIAKVITRNLKHNFDSNGIDMFEVVRLAAIFHDCGHVFYSHVSEKFFTSSKKYKYVDNVTSALTFFNERISARAAFHEMLSVMIVNSDEVYRFFTLIAKHFDQSKLLHNDDVDLFIDYISGLIVGTAVDKKSLPYSTIIKGAIDADRMDYLSRDSSTTKVPLAVDIPRLINKITVVKINNYQPAQVWNDHSGDDAPYLSMAIGYSAQSLIGQFSTARSILYESVYFHHKKLTAEAMFRKACEGIFQLVPDEKSCDFSYIMSLTDNALSEYFSEIVVPSELREDIRCKEAHNIFIRIKNRDLYKRVASFSKDILDSVPNYIYEDFVTNIIEDPFSDAYIEFIKLLTEEYYMVLTCLNRPRENDMPDFMFIETNWKSDMSDDIPIDFGNAPYKMSSQVYKETPFLGEGNRQKQYYLVTNQINRDLVYIALEHLLYLKYGIKIQEGSSTCAKFANGQIDKLKYSLFELNFYRDALSLLPDRIVKGLFDLQVFRAVVAKYQSYTGVRGTKVTEQTLFNFLRQFLLVHCDKDEIRILLKSVLSLLAEATFIDRDFFSKNASSLMNKILAKGYKNNLMVKLGGAFDSANRLTYYFNDVKEKQGFRFVETVSDALKIANDPDSCIVFFDDGAYSGKQVVSIFQELMGVPLEERETDEIHTEELDDASKEQLKSARIILGYICFNRKSRENILQKLKDLGVCNVEIVFEEDLSEKIFSENSQMFVSKEECNIVRRLLQEIGYQVQKSSKQTSTGAFKDRWDEDRVKNSALGYNDAQQMVVFEFNVPTYTLTPFWQNGKYNNWIWQGLFQRTDK